MHKYQTLLCVGVTLFAFVGLVGCGGATLPNSASSSSSGSSSSNSSSSGSSSSGAISAIEHAFFVGNTSTSGEVRNDFNQYWNQITPELEGKWTSVESLRDIYNWNALDRTYNYAKQNGILFKQSSFVWGASAQAWLINLSASETAEEIEEWISEFCNRYPDTDMIDVVNEATPGHYPASFARKAFGENWITKVFQLARQHCPRSVLILNDYYIISWDHEKFITMAKPIVQSGYVDVLGLQAHGLEDFSAEQIKSRLDNLWDQLHVPMYITEYDLNISDDEKQLQQIQAQFPVFYNHPHVKGITLWGYIYGKTWVPSSGLIRQDGTFRPAMTWLMNYIKQNPK
ncbi:MAG TPA: endo-1,4-beta-xylanase [Cellvibrionaceae bacterium]